MTAVARAADLGRARRPAAGDGRWNAGNALRAVPAYGTASLAGAHAINTTSDNHDTGAGT